MTNPTAIPTMSLGPNFCRSLLNFTSVWWQVGRSMSPPFEPDPRPESAHVTSCTPHSRNLHNVPRALSLMPCVSLIISLYVCVVLFVFWRKFERSSAGGMVNVDQGVHQLLEGRSSWWWVGVVGGPSNKQCYFQNTNCSPRIPCANLQP